MRSARYCKICGARIKSSAHNQVYCSRECRKEAEALYNERRARWTREVRANIEDVNKILRKADAEGLTYGQYVAKLYAAEEARKRDKKRASKVSSNKKRG